MGDTVCHRKDRRSFSTVGHGKIDPSADVERGTSNDNRCCRSHERRGARDDANRCRGDLGRANQCLLRHRLHAGIISGGWNLSGSLSVCIDRATSSSHDGRHTEELKMELNVTISVLVLLPVALALIGGGLVLYRRSTREGWRAAGMGSLVLGVGTLLVFALTLPVSSEGEAPEPVIGAMVPRPTSVEELVAGAHVIVLGQISSVLEEKWIGPYGEDGRPMLTDEDGLPFTDYLLQIESVLKGDGTVTDGGSLVLRMFGHLSNQNAIVTPDLFPLPDPGDHLLFALGRNPDGTYGTGPERLLNLDGEKVVYVDGVPFATEASPDQFVRQIRDAAADGPDPSMLVYDYTSLINDLGNAGATVDELTGSVSPIGFSVGGRSVGVNGGTIQVYEFPHGLAADTEAG